MSNGYRPVSDTEEPTASGGSTIDDGRGLESEDMFGITRRNTEDSVLILHFDGPLLAGHSMDVRDFAPALIGFADAVDRYGNYALPMSDLNVDIKATSPGSFQALLQVTGSVANLLQAFGASDTGKMISGLLDILKILAERFKVSGDVKPLPHEVVKYGKTHVGLSLGGLRFDLDRSSYEASCDSKLINDLGAATAPSKKDGIDSVDFYQPSTHRTESVSGALSSAMSAFRSDDEELEPSVADTTLQIDTLQLRSEKWKFFDGTDHFWATIADETFLKRWKAREISFNSGATMRVRLETELYEENGEIRKGDRRILHVYGEDDREAVQPALDLG